ncbi:UDP-N-acetylglucosamine 2-epimerase [Ureibacillus thermosphaericus]|uniref:UDP-N-acetylglucosamine 2-epimerase n=1 Tax=Ureibacillus thermosphaericus TaxID=51173 RepID=UPI0030C9BDB9
MKRKICVVTATRAEYGLLCNLMKRIQEDEEFELQIVATGMHLSPEFGLTFHQIEKDGFFINEKVEILISSDSPQGVVKSMGLANISFADVFERLKPDLIIILGDRFEMLSVAQTALIMQIPIAHIHGGECTFGAYDDAIRHSITKMATWHFTSCETHRKRVIQLGEHPSRVWNVGALFVENIRNLPLLTKEELYKKLNLNPNKECLLITYHPETTGEYNAVHELLKALKAYQNFNLVFTKSNADNGGRFINKEIEKSLKNFENAYLYDSLGTIKYLSLAKYAKVVIGNSSSGLGEVPYLHTPTVNIGNRQAGRERPNSVIDCESNVLSIQNGIVKALQYNGNYQQIFGDGNTSKKIVEILKSIPDFKVIKEFYDL